ncbi:hypothetical protein [Leucobacter soli]|uniref:hypothetical protein n=1 Tax=Leucobacter soli TaxID=2812850 RepID=UPI0036083A8D
MDANAPLPAGSTAPPAPAARLRGEALRAGYGPGHEILHGVDVEVLEGSSP